MQERDVERKLVQGVKALGGRAYKFISPGCDGVPDRIVVMPKGGVYFVEVKSEKGQLSTLQRQRIVELAVLGHRVAVVRGVEEVELFLQRIGENGAYLPF